MSLKQNPSAFENRVRAMIDGLRKDFPPSEQEVMFGGKAMTLAELHARFQHMAATLEEVHRSQRAHRFAVERRRSAMQDFRSLYDDGVLFVRHQFGRESRRAMSYGVAVPKPRRALTSEAAAIAKAKAAATRALRGTKGKKQRAAITLAGQLQVQVFGADGKPLPGQEPISEPDLQATGLE